MAKRKMGTITRTYKKASGRYRKRKNPFAKGTASFAALEEQKAAMGRRLSATRRKLKEKGTPAKAALCIGSGGAAAGFVSTQFPSLMGVSTPLLFGSALVAFGIYSDEKYANTLSCFGSGMLAAGMSDYVKNAMTYDRAWNPIDQPGLMEVGS